MSDYVFSDNEKNAEIKRLQGLIKACDPFTINKLQSLNISENALCLEIGAGLGSIAKWLSQIVYKGKVIANDINTEHIDQLNIANLEVLKGDIRHLDLEDSSFDLIHARYVFIHIQDSHDLIVKLFKSLKPGGYLFIEEPDFSYESTISSPHHEIMDKVNRAITLMYDKMGLNIDIGQKLAPLVSSLDFKSIQSYADLHYQNGGSDMAIMMKNSCEYLREKYLETALVNESDIKNYLKICDHPNIWTHYFTTFSVIAEK